MFKKIRMGTGKLKRNGAQTGININCNNAMFTYLIKLDGKKGVFLMYPP